MEGVIMESGDLVRAVLKQSGYETSEFSQNLFRVAASNPLSVHSRRIGCLCSPENTENFGTLLSFAQE